MATMLKYAIIVGTEADLDAGKGVVAMTFTEVAASLGFSEAKLRSLIKDGSLVLVPVAKIGRSGLYLSSEVEKLKGRA